MPGSIFISYRRAGGAKDARAIFERLRRELGDHRVFIDLEGIEPGEDFVDSLGRQLDGCEALVVLIGPDWSGVTNEHGARRLDDENDFVRIEVGVALRRGVKIFPVLLDGALPPRASELPDELRPLVRRQAVVLDYAKFDADVARLARAIARALEPGVSRLPEARPAIPIQEPMATLDSDLLASKTDSSQPRRVPDPESSAAELGPIADQIGSPTSLSFDEQLLLITRLQKLLRDGGASTLVKELMSKLRRREDLYARIAVELDALSKERDRAQAIPKRTTKAQPRPVRAVSVPLPKESRPVPSSSRSSSGKIRTRPGGGEAGPPTIDPEVVKTWLVPNVAWPFPVEARPAAGLCTTAASLQDVGSNVVRAIRTHRTIDLMHAAQIANEHFLYTNLSNAKSKQEVLERIVRAFLFPPHFAKNFDALYYCMADLVHESGQQPGFVVVLLADNPGFDREVREQVLDVFRDAAAFWGERQIPFRCFYSFQ